jgi:hypothetical protein
VFISKAHSLTDMSHTGNPAPGDYSLRSTFGSENHSYLLDSAMTARGHPGYGFGTALKNGDKTTQVYISPHHVGPDPASPGPIYDTQNVYTVGTGLPHVNFGAQQRFFRLEGAMSPGPAVYNIAEAQSLSNLVPESDGISIGTSKRSVPGKGYGSLEWVPGPGAYAPKQVGSCSSSLFSATSHPFGP